MKPALMILDLQKAFYRGKAIESMNHACEYINAILPTFRGKGLPVIWVKHRDKKEGLVEGNPEFEFIDQLKAVDGEVQIIKEYGNAFNKTECKEILQKNGIDTVIISGYRAEYCVLSTYRGAMDIDLTPILLKGSLAGEDEENVGFVYKISDVITRRELVKVLKNC